VSGIRLLLYTHSLNQSINQSLTHSLTHPLYSTPLAPTYAGCFAAEGYTHDAQCVTYDGPHTAYIDREICFAYNVNALTIVDVTDKSNPTLISSTGTLISLAQLLTPIIFIDHKIHPTHGTLIHNSKQAMNIRLTHTKAG
jgi:hypothetical protein